MKRARQGEKSTRNGPRHPDVHCRDILSAVFAYWSGPHLFRFAVALGHVLRASVPAPPPTLPARERSAAESAWLCACSVVAESARYARLTQVPVVAYDSHEDATSDDADRVWTVSLAEVTCDLAAQFASHFRVGLFDDIAVRTAEEEVAHEAQRTATQRQLIARTRACTALLLAHDTRVQRLVFGDAARFFACESPLPERAASFLRACTQFSTAFDAGDMTLEDVGHAASEAWMFGRTYEDLD
jgi:hypothetical protein